MGGAEGARSAYRCFHMGRIYSHLVPHPLGLIQDEGQ